MMAAKLEPFNVTVRDRVVVALEDRVMFTLWLPLPSSNMILSLENPTTTAGKRI